MSLNLKPIKTQFSFTLHAQILELYPTENPIKIKHGSRDIAILAMLKTLKYKGNRMLLLAQSKNQY